jgi:ADP-ribose pyrophosphatase YjhB (NUDIX family)
MEQISVTHPSKIFSYCPRCGQKGFLFDGVKAHNCSSCNFKLYINAATAIAAILVAPDGTIVLTRRKNEPRAGTFDLPGGFVDKMERAEEAVRREIYEELGVVVSSMQYLTSYANEYVYRGISYFTCDLAFVCPVSDLSALHPSDDVSEAIVVKPHEIDFNTISFPSIVSILNTYISNLL